MEEVLRDTDHEEVLPMLEKLKNEPAVLLAVAAGIIVLGVDLAQLTETVERIVQLLVIVGAGKGIRESVYSPATHERKVRNALEVQGALQDEGPSE